MAFGLHLLLSLIIIIICAIVVFGFWYPYPFDEIAGVRNIFFILFIVDLVCGPLLTWIISNPKKNKFHLGADYLVIFSLQLVAVFYGLYTMAQVRPVWIAFEGDRFRLVSASDVNYKNINLAQEEFRSLSLSGPKLIGVKLLKDFEGGFKESIIDSVGGNHPAFRPARWVNYNSQVDSVIASAKLLNNRSINNIKDNAIIYNAVSKIGLGLDQVGYLPLMSDKSDEWTVLINMKTGIPEKYIKINGWE